METFIPPCQHQWNYYVDVADGAVRTRRCGRCGVRAALPTTVAGTVNAEAVPA